MNLPNKITVFRVILIPVFLVFLLVQAIPYGKPLALMTFIVASLTDFLDGRIARKYNLITNFGKFMDPLADKLLVCSALIAFVGLGLIPSWVIIIIIGREFIISGFRLVAVDNGVVIAASYWAKRKTAVQMVMCCFYILHLQNQIWQMCELVLLGLALILTIVSLIEYIAKNRQVLADYK